MTVMVTGGSGVVGHALVRRLVGEDEVRVCVRRSEAAEPLRALGAKVALGRLDDADALAEVLGGVFTLFHLVGGPHQPDVNDLLDANHGSAVRAVAAARAAGVRRIVLVSVPGASPDASDPFLRAKGLAEEVVVTSGLEHAVVRATHVYGLGGLWFTAVVQGALSSPPIAVGGADPVAPLLVEDLAAVLGAADGHEAALEGTWALEGPDDITPGDLAGLLADDAQGPARALGADGAGELEALLGIPLSPAAAAHLLRTERADAPDAAVAFGVARTPLVDGLRRTLARAATVPPPAR
jgi:uncharacterized protein YbjT (DUF2867 family)